MKVLDEEIRQGEQALKQAEEAYVQAQIAAQDERFAGLSGEEAAEREPAVCGESGKRDVQGGRLMRNA